MYVYVCMYVYMCIYMYMYVYIYIYIYWNEFKCDLFFYKKNSSYYDFFFSFFFVMLSQHNIVTVIQLTFCIVMIMGVIPCTKDSLLLCYYKY